MHLCSSKYSGPALVKPGESDPCPSIKLRTPQHVLTLGEFEFFREHKYWQMKCNSTTQWILRLENMLRQLYRYSLDSRVVSNREQKACINRILEFACALDKPFEQQTLETYARRHFSLDISKRIIWWAMLIRKAQREWEFSNNQLQMFNKAVAKRSWLNFKQNTTEIVAQATRYTTYFHLKTEGLMDLKNRRREEARKEFIWDTFTIYYPFMQHPLPLIYLSIVQQTQIESSLRKMNINNQTRFTNQNSKPKGQFLQKLDDLKNRPQDLF